MKTLDELLDIDASCARESELVFKDLAESLSCANAGLVLFEEAGKWMSAYEADNPAQKRFDEAAAELGVSGPELLAAIRKPTDPSEHAAIVKTRGADRDIGQIIGYHTLLQLAYRSYRSGLTDLRRLKLTAAAGHLRVETESAALILLFFDQPTFAERWVNPEENMLKFFRESQPHLKKYLADHELSMAYEHGSAISQHARFASAARGIRMEGNSITVLDQEFDPKDPVTFHLAIAYFLRCQTRIFKMLTSKFPQLASHVGFKEAFERYQNLEEKTWWVLERKYANEINAFST
jgi:hypothetical protein